MVITSDAMSAGAPIQQLERPMALCPGFATSLYASSEGYVEKSIPSELLSGLSQSQRYVNDRPYFAQAQQFPLGYSSGIFQGRGLGDQPSAPIYKNDEFYGVVEGSLKLDQLERFIPNLFEYKGDLLVLDADKKKYLAR